MSESVSRPTFTAFIDESIVERWETTASAPRRSKVGHRLLVGAAVTSQPDRLHEIVSGEAARVVADDALWEPRGGHKEPHVRRRLFRKEGFHFALDSPPIRDRGLSAMRQVDLRFHAFYSDRYLAEDGASDLQISILFTLAHTLLRRYAGSELTFVFENANDAIEKLYGSVVAQAAEYLDAADGKKGIPRASGRARIGRKPLGGLAAADYALGIINLDLGQNKEPRREHDDRLLRRADPHVAHVMNFDRAVHRRRFDTVGAPSWARHIVGASSRPGVDGANPNLIPEGSTGPFTFWESVEQLATGLGYTPEALQAVRDKASRESSYTFPTAKIKGKVRRFTVAKDPAVEDAQRRIGYLLNQLAEILHPSCSAYVPGRSAVDAARPHVGHRWAQRLDIEDFFLNTSEQCVQATLMDLGATAEVAEALASITTYEGALPAGARTSPMMSNLVLAKFDYAVSTWAGNTGLTYSRYADDLVLSGDHEFDATPQVAELLRPLGYELNLSKSRLKRRGQPFRVAGLTIDEGGPRVRKSLKRRLRMELFLLNTVLAAAVESTDEAREAIEELDRADQMLFERARGLARYCVGIEFEWTMALLEKYPYAQAAIWVAPKPGRWERAVHHLANQIRARDVLVLGDESRPVGAPPLLENRAEWALEVDAFG